MGTYPRKPEWKQHTRVPCPPDHTQHTCVWLELQERFMPSRDQNRWSDFWKHLWHGSPAQRVVNECITGVRVSLTKTIKTHIKIECWKEICPFCTIIIFKRKPSSCQKQENRQFPASFNGKIFWNTQPSVTAGVLVVQPFWKIWPFFGNMVLLKLHSQAPPRNHFFHGRPCSFCVYSTVLSAVEPAGKAGRDGPEVQNWKIALS